MWDVKQYSTIPMGDTYCTDKLREIRYNRQYYDETAEVTIRPKDIGVYGYLSHLGLTLIVENIRHTHKILTTKFKIGGP